MVASFTRKLLVGVAFITLIASLIFAYLNQTRSTDLYRSTNGIVDAKYFQHVSPIGIAFSIIWPVIYLWNIVAILYVLISIFLPETKSPVNTEPTLISYPFLIVYILTWSTTVGWLFAFDNEILELSFALLIIAWAAACITIGVSCKLVHESQIELKDNSKVMLWLFRILMQNGLGLPATWLIFPTFLTFANVIIYQNSSGVTPAVLRGTVSIVDGSTIALFLLLTLIIVWFILENFVWEKYCRYIFTFYPVLILGLSGVVARIRNIPDARRNLILVSAMLGISVLLFLIRIILSIYRWKKRCKTEMYNRDVLQSSITEMAAYT